MLKITVGDEANKVRITVEGELSGDLARVLEANWRKAVALHQHETKIVDLRGVTRVDAIGRQVLGLMMDDGAEFVVSGLKTAYLIDTLRTECKRRRANREAGRLTVVAAVLLLLITLIAVAAMSPYGRNLRRLNLDGHQIVRNWS